MSHNKSWPSGSEAKAWSRFGKRMARTAFVLVMAFIILPLLLGVFLATAVGGWTSVVIALISWFGLAALFVIFLRFALRAWWPVRDLIETTGRLADGDYSARVPPTGSAPMREVVRSFNRMAERVESAEDGRRRLLADVGHELRTPLTIVRGELEAMADGVHELDEDRLRQLLGDLAVMERLLDDLATLSTAEAGTLRIHREPTDVVRLTSDAVERLEPDALAAGVTLTASATNGGRLLDAEIDPVRVREILLNLIGNAIRATPTGGRVSTTVTSVVVDGDEQLELTVEDNGAGIPPDQLDRVFERFHKGPDSTGTGLGLTISRNLAEAHGGRITVESTVGIGTTVTVRLPAD